MLHMNFLEDESYKYVVWITIILSNIFNKYLNILKIYEYIDV